MKYNRLLWILSLFLLTATSSEASHMVGADLTYSCTPTAGVWKVRLVIYRDCSGIPLCPGSGSGTPCNAACTQSVSIQGADPSCMGTSFGNFTVSLVSVSEVNANPQCPTAKSICTSMGCSIAGSYTPGIEKYVFEGNVNLGSGSGIPSSCCNVSLYWAQCCRNAIISTGSSGNGFYTEAIINRCLGTSPCNSSPQMSNDPFAIICSGQPYVFNMGATDPDHDSLSFAFVPALQAQGSSVSYIAPYTYSAPMPHYPPATAPFPMGISCNPSNGDIAFTPVTTSGTFVGVMAVEIKQWKNISGVPTVIGLVRRDIQMWVISCPPDNTPTFNTNPGNGSQPKYSWIATAGTQLCFDIIGKDTDYLPFNTPPISDTTTLSWNQTLAQYGATLTSNYVDSMRRTLGPREDTKKFCWTPDSSKVSLMPWYFTATVKDSRCPNAGQLTRSFSITVVAELKASITQTKNGCNRVMCSYIQTGTPSTITYSKWTVSKVPNVYTLSSADTFTNMVSTPYLNFTQTGKYLVRLNLTASGGNTKVLYDTIVIDNIPLQINVADTSICKGNSATFQYQATGGKPPYSYRWFIAPDTFFAALNAPFFTATSFTVSPATTTRFTIQARDSMGCRAYDSSVIVTVGFAAGNLPTSTRICYGTSYTLDPGNASGKVKKYLWNTGDTTRTITRNDSNLFVVTLTDSVNCQDRDSMMLYVNQPVSAFAGNDSTVCGSRSIVLHGSGGQFYVWKNLSTGATLSPKSSIPDITVTPTATTKYELTVFTTQGGVECSKRDTMMITVKPLPVSTLPASWRMCSGNTYTLDAGNNGGKPVKYLWNTGDTLRTITRNDSNLFIVTLTDTAGCKLTDSLMLYVNKPVIASAGKDSVFCTPKNVTLRGTGGQNYQWKNLNTNTVISAKSAVANVTVVPAVVTTYELIAYVVQGGLECSNRDSVMLTPVAGIAVDAGTPHNFCGGDAAYVLSSQSPTPSSGIWNGPAVSTSGTQQVFTPGTANLSPLNNILYYVLGNAPCYNYDSVIFTVFPKPSPAISGTATIAAGQPTTFNVTNTTGSSYNWFVANGAINSGNGTNAVSATFANPGAGMVKVIETAATSCKSDTAYKTVTVTPFSGIAQQEMFNHLSVYPNPTSGQLNITFESSEKSIDVQVFDIMGRQVMKSTNRHSGGMFQKSLDMSNLNRGIYFVQISSEKGSTTVKVTLK